MMRTALVLLSAMIYIPRMVVKAILVTNPFFHMLVTRNVQPYNIVELNSASPIMAFVHTILAIFLKITHMRVHVKNFVLSERDCILIVYYILFCVHQQGKKNCS